ncbi:plasminogen-like [Bolinopsis microptera]|uniref:plasminogen-like n=1 Tax=Bolinopsis microptera TaxID=2820187 RepID=UPI003078EFDC
MLMFLILVVSLDSAYSQENIDCYNGETDQFGRQYRGYKARTENGLVCQKWTSQTPNQHTRKMSKFPDAGLGDHNYCRNPESEDTGPWCYNSEGTKPRWKGCGIPDCATGVLYKITYSVPDKNNAKTENPQYVKITGSAGETEERLCDSNFDVTNQDVECVFWSNIKIGEYKCVSLRTGGDNGLDFTQVKVKVDGKTVHTIVTPSGEDYIELDDYATKVFCKVKQG